MQIELGQSRRPGGRREASRGVLDPSSDAEIVLYDFRRPTKLARDHVRVLQSCFETFGRGMGTLLTTSLRTVCEANLLGLEQQTYGEYVAALSSPTIMAPLRIKPLAGTAVFEFGVSAGLGWVDHLLGGPGGPQTARELSDIELCVVRNLLDEVVRLLPFSLEPIVRCEPQVGEIEFNPPFLQAAAANDLMIVASFELHIADEISVATLCLPFAGVLALLPARAPQPRAQSAEQSARAERYTRDLRRGLGGVPVDVAVRFTPVQMNTAQILGLVHGDIVRLNHRVNAPLDVLCDGVTLTHALIGREGTRLAALVVDQKLETNP